ncbi:OmpA family protein [Vannielia litorea]|uniref:Outer membrane protein OmpA n=1 Tax=Vannielia litorea TaxID=1217970 RepID=A0A1N6H751_9RHOB|nr:OmpA family protein [Vannielia litorea]SIO15599.1 Outer membrane protein OmpA [Vannielia litorea]
MFRRFAIILALAFVAAAPAAAQGNLDPGWLLDPSASNLRFQSIKKEVVSESSDFATFTGEIFPNGKAELRVALESVDTKIDLRNVRMRFLFFETFKFPEAIVLADVTADMVKELENKRRANFSMPFSLDLHGVKKTLVAEVVATLLNDDRISVATARPVAISVDEFGLMENLGKLEDAAKVDIVPSATVTFDFLFDRRGTNGAPLTGGRSEVDATNAAVGEAEVFDKEACEGRFEILSRTGNIYFASGSSRLDDASEPLLKELLDITSRCPGIEVEVAGHTDSVGKASYNQQLSERRARSVADYLIRNGIAPERLSAKGYGEDKPVASNDTAEGKGKNRRIEFLPRTN